MFSAKQLQSGGYAGANANPFTELTKQAQKQPPKKKAAAAAVVADADLDAAAARKRQKNREKRQRKKKAAAVNGNGASKADESDESDDEEDEPQAAAAPAAVAVAAAASAPAAPSAPVAVETAEDDSPDVTASGSDSDSGDSDDDDEPSDDEDDSSVGGSSGPEEEEDDDPEELAEDRVAAQVVHLGHDPHLVATARRQMNENGIVFSMEMLLLVVQQEEALAQERKSGKLAAVFKPKPAAAAAAQPAKKTPSPTVAVAAAPAPGATKQPAKVVAAAKAAAAAAAPSPKAAPAAAKGRASTPAAAPAPAVATLSVAPAAAAAASSSSSSAVAAATAPRDDYTVAGLERSARAWNPLPPSSSADALSLLESWCTFLERASGSTLPLSAQRSFVADPVAADFAKNFHASQALEIVVRACMDGPTGTNAVWTAASEATQEGAKIARALDAPLLRLMTQALSSGSNASAGRTSVAKVSDARFLLDSFRALAKTLEKASVVARPAMISKALQVLTEARRIATVHRQIEATLAEENRTGVPAATAAAGSEAAALAELSKQSVDPALFFGAAAASASPANGTGTDSSGVRAMWLSSFSQSSALSSAEVSLGRFGSILVAAPQHALQMTFHLLERDIQLALDAANRAGTQHAEQSSVVATQRATLEAARAREMAVHATQAKEQLSREGELLKRKSELLNELDKVNHSLEVVLRAKDATAKATGAIESQYARNLASLQGLAAESAGRAQALKQDALAASAIHAMVVGSYDRLSSLSAAQVQRVVNAQAAAASKHLQGVAALLATQASLVDFLSKRATFCRSKLSVLDTERSEARAFGLPASVGSHSAESEKGLRSMLAQDTRVAATLKNSALALVKRTAKNAMVAQPNTVGIPPNQLAQLYAQLLATIDTKKIEAVFEVQPLRDALKELNARAAQAAASAQAAQVAAANNASPSPASPVAANGSASSAAVVTPTAASAAVTASPAPLASASSPSPVAAAAASSSPDPFDVAAANAKKQQPRKSMKERQRELEASKQQQSQQLPQQPQPQQQQSQRQPKGRNGAPATAAATTAASTSSAPTSSRIVKKQPAPSSSNAAAASSISPPASSPTLPLQPPSSSPAAAAVAAKPVVTPALPAKSWSTNTLTPSSSPANSSSASGAHSDAFPALSSANLQKVKAAEKQAAKMNGSTNGAGSGAATAATAPAAAAVVAAAPVAESNTSAAAQEPAEEKKD